MRGLAAKTPRSLHADPASAPIQPFKDGFRFHPTHTSRKRATYFGLLAVQRLGSNSSGGDLQWVIYNGLKK